MAVSNAYVIARARALGLDPAAVFAIGSHESGNRDNAVGDGGTSFGRWQLHVGGALPSGKGAAWAGSKAGVNYALEQMSRVARGLHGRAAVSAISTRFERPADPAAEIADAMAHYGGFGSIAGGNARGGLGPTGGGGGGHSGSQFNPAAFHTSAAQLILANAVANANGQQLTDPSTGQPVNVLSALAAAKASSMQQGGAHPSHGVLRPQKATGGGFAKPGSLAELLYTGPGHTQNVFLDGHKVPANSIGSALYQQHTNHDHFASMNPRVMLAAIKHAQAMGMHVGENSYVGSPPAPGVHAPHSYHYRVLGTFNGRKLDAAADISGSPQQMAAFYRWAARHYG